MTDSQTPPPDAPDSAAGNPGPAPRPLFDEHGLFTGELGDQMWPVVCESLEARLEEEGWDRPARLYAVVNPVQTEARVGVDVVEFVHRTAADLARLDHNPEQPSTGPEDTSGAVAFSLVDLGAVTGHPVDELWGRLAPDFAAALVLAFEGWTIRLEHDADGNVIDEAPHLPPSKHPRRVEVRSVLMVTRAGGRYMISRMRGQEPKVENASGLDGFVPDTIARMLGVPTGPAPATVADILGRMALTSALASVRDTFGPPGHERTGLSPAEIAERDALRAELAALDPDDREALAAAVLPRALWAAAAGIAWAATEYGDVGVDRPLRKFLKQAAEQGAGEPEHERALVAAAGAAAGRSFLDLVTGRRARTVMPPRLVLHAGWVDEGLAGRWLAWKGLDSQAAMLEWTEAELGAPAARAATDLLELIGWSSRERTGPGDVPGPPGG